MVALFIFFLVCFIATIVSYANSWRRFYYGNFTVLLNTFFWFCIGAFLDIGSTGQKAMQLFCICAILNLVLFNVGFFFFSELYKRGTDFR